MDEDSWFMMRPERAAFPPNDRWTANRYNIGVTPILELLGNNLSYWLRGSDKSLAKLCSYDRPLISVKHNTLEPQFYIYTIVCFINMHIPSSPIPNNGIGIIRCLGWKSICFVVPPCSEVQIKSIWRKIHLCDPLRTSPLQEVRQQLSGRGSALLAGGPRFSPQWQLLVGLGKEKPQKHFALKFWVCSILLIIYAQSASVSLSIPLSLYKFYKHSFCKCYKLTLFSFSFLKKAGDLEIIWCSVQYIYWRMCNPSHHLPKNLYKITHCY